MIKALGTLNRLAGSIMPGWSKEVKKIVKNNKERWDNIPPVLLSPQEIDLLKAIGEGLAGRELGKAFKMTPGSANKSRAKLIEKLGVRNVSQLMIFACQNGIL